MTATLGPLLVDAADTSTSWSLSAPADDLLAAGAVRLPDGTMLDPQGNEFSAAQPGRPAG